MNQDDRKCGMFDYVFYILALAVVLIVGFVKWKLRGYIYCEH